MSRVGKKPVNIANGIACSIEKNVVVMKKENVEEKYVVPACLSVTCDDNHVVVTPLDGERTTRALWGTTQRNLQNIANGLSTGFSVGLKMVGVGYRASVNGSVLTMQLGFSHDVNYTIPDGVSVKCPEQTTIVVSGRSRKQVGDVVAYIRKFRRPEPYKGKGVMKVNEHVYRKEGKKK